MEDHNYATVFLKNRSFIEKKKSLIQLVTYLSHLYSGEQKGPQNKTFNRSIRREREPFRTPPPVCAHQYLLSKPFPVNLKFVGVEVG